MAERVTTVETDELIPITTYVTVSPPCAERYAGVWYCVTHRQEFSNNFGKDHHITEGRHVLAWRCSIHGMEKP